MALLVGHIRTKTAMLRFCAAEFLMNTP